MVGIALGEPVVLYEEVNPAFGAYNMTFTSPIESQPGGMTFYVQAVNLENGSTFTNPNYNSIRLILDGNSPLVLSATPMDGEERRRWCIGRWSIRLRGRPRFSGPTSPTQSPLLGRMQGLSDAIGCTDYNLDGLPNEDEYELVVLGSLRKHEQVAFNIAEGLIDDSMLLHKQRVSFYVSGQDEQDNEYRDGATALFAPFPPSPVATVRARSFPTGTPIW